MATSARDDSAEQRQQQLRSAILKIHANGNLSMQDKARQMQDLMSSSYKARLPSQLKKEHEEEERITYHNIEKNMIGCTHYARNCKVKSACCDKLYVCRFCHDDAEDHLIDRHAIKEMMCMFCKTIQPIAQRCANPECEQIMAVYFCSICNLVDNDSEKKIYHCEKCGLCRIGEGLDKDYFHCDKCNVCMAVKLRDKHKCIEHNLESNCPICSEFMFTSTSTVIFMKCGHCIHHECYNRHIKNSYQCPVCLKSLGNMDEYFHRIDIFMEDQIMPEEYKDSKAQISCNDCEQRSETAFNFSYHK
eukprot:Ihof_evm1s202 gene=Ihof_evmTU1s202